ncbi:MAG: hypothetical protein P8X47_10240 [Ignavibacteriaceae bacterium]
MLQKKKKLSKKEIKQDKLVELYYNFENFFNEYKSKILTYAGIVVVAAGMQELLLLQLQLFISI